jgi:hypothetical protein
MSQSTSIKLFEDKNIRTLWDDENEKWYFSVVDVVGVLADNPRPRKYWNDLKRTLKEMGSELSEKIGQLKLQSADGKFYLTDVADTSQLLRLIQSIPSPRAEPFKLWLAAVGSERLDEIADPEIAVQRGLDYYKRYGYSDAWIMQRLKSIEIRKELTNEWDKSGVKKGLEYALLTDELTSAWSGMTTREYKKVKNLKKESLRDNMTNGELVLNMLAEFTATQISSTEKPKNFHGQMSIAERAGKIAGDARRKIESESGKSVITGKNAKSLKVLK